MDFNETFDRIVLCARAEAIAHGFEPQVGEIMHQALLDGISDIRSQEQIKADLDALFGVGNWLGLMEAVADVFTRCSHLYDPTTERV